MTRDQSIPQNYVSKRPYSGVNHVLLWDVASVYPTAQFLTFKQATDLGGHVKKGEKGYPVYYVGAVNRTRITDTGEEEEDTMRFLKLYWVFNVAQTEGIDLSTDAIPLPRPDLEERREEADVFLSCTKADIREGHGEAYFAPSKDFISMPAFDTFKNADNFYSTIFHELGHWTGHKTRLDREFGKRFGDKAYAQEELVAEITAAMLCAEFGFDNDLRHAGYIDHWIKLLSDHNKAFFTAASQASKAVELVRNLALAEPESVNTLSAA